MKRPIAAALSAACLIGSLAISGPAMASSLQPRVGKTSCTTMGLTAASLRPLFGTVAVTAAGYSCGLVANGLAVTLYLYPASERAAVIQELGVWRHPVRLGGLGAGAALLRGTDGAYGLRLTSGTHFVYVDGQLLPSQGKLISLAHIIYRALL